MRHTSAGRKPASAASLDRLAAMIHRVESIPRDWDAIQEGEDDAVREVLRGHMFVVLMPGYKEGS
jgi:hypothetical protein